MEDIWNESLLNTNKKPILSFASIPEKKEEISNSSLMESQLEKRLKSDKSSKNKFLKLSNFPKNIYFNDNNKFLQKLSIFQKKSPKSFNPIVKDKERKYSYNNNKMRIIRKSSSKKENNNNEVTIIKKSSSKKENNNYIKNIHKTISFQNKFNYDIIGQIFGKRRNSSSKYANLSPQIKKTITFKGKQNINIQTLNNPLNDNNISNNNVYKLFSNNSISSRMILRNKSFNTSSIETINQFFKKPKVNIILNNKKLKINDGYEGILQIRLFEKLKKSPMFEKSEKLLYKEKLLFGFLGFSTLMSIIFQICDVILYNKNTYKYLINIYSYEKINLNNINDYIQERTISREENCVRIFNIIFSFFSLILTLNLHNNKNKYIKQENKNNKNFYIYYNNKYYNFNKRKKKSIEIEDKHISIIPNNDEALPKKKLPISEIIKTILSFIINLVLCPPLINKSFVFKQKEETHIISLSSIILIFTFFKIIIIYRSIIHLSPLNNLIYKTICKSKMVNMDFLFIIRYFLNRFPMTFILINLIIIGLIFCMLILSIEYFSFDNQKGFQANIIDNNLQNFGNILNLYLFYILKNIYEKNIPSTLLSLFIMIILCASALIIISYLVYYMNELIEFKPEEQKAFTKLTKIFNPINKEHKAANLVKVFILMKKLSKDFKNTENEYTIKKTKKNLEFQKKKSKRLQLF